MGDGGGREREREIENKFTFQKERKANSTKIKVGCCLRASNWGCGLGRAMVLYTFLYQERPGVV